MEIDPNPGPLMPHCSECGDKITDPPKPRGGFPQPLFPTYCSEACRQESEQRLAKFWKDTFGESPPYPIGVRSDVPRRTPHEMKERIRTLKRMAEHRDV